MALVEAAQKQHHQHLNQECHAPRAADHGQEQACCRRNRSQGAATGGIWRQLVVIGCCQEPGQADKELDRVHELDRDELAQESLAQLQGGLAARLAVITRHQASEQLVYDEASPGPAAGAFAGWVRMHACNPVSESTLCISGSHGPAEQPVAGGSQGAAASKAVRSTWIYTDLCRYEWIYTSIAGSCTTHVSTQVLLTCAAV